MNVLAKITTVAAAMGMTSQPCLAAAAESDSKSLARPLAASAAAHGDFDLERHVSGAAVTSLTLAASQQTASEIQDPPTRKGPGTTTWLIVGGVALLVVVLLAVGAAAPAPGPREGDFN